MGLGRVNIARVELDARLDEAGFRHAAAAVGERLGAARIGAGLYEAEAGAPIWPYHYHHGIEEWLYVIAGAPVLREPAGERQLTAGDVVCFPSGHTGAHTVKGPGRFVIFATGQFEEPYLSVYPDSDKVSGPSGILLRSSAVGYWHGEGAGAPAEPPVVVREPEETPPPRPVVNVAQPQSQPQPQPPPQRLGPRLGAERFDATVVELAPGEESDPYHHVFGQEEWMLVLAGTATVRHPDGEDGLEPGDLVCFPEGPTGARQVSNPTGALVRALLISTTGLPANVHYPESGRWVLRNGPGREDVTLRAGA